MQFQTLVNTLKYYLGPKQFYCHKCGDRTQYQRLYIEYYKVLSGYVGDSVQNYCPSCASEEIARVYTHVAPKQHSYCTICNNVGPWITDAGHFGFSGPICPTCVSEVLEYGEVCRAFGSVYDGTIELNEAGAIIFT